MASMPNATPEVKSKKPSNSAFKQQRLASWQPILTAGTVLPTFFVIGILFIPVGIGLWYFSDNVREVAIDYTNCKSTNGDIPCSDIVNATNGAICHCKKDFELSGDFKGKVYIYYALTNFYQNHRRYVKSRDDSQLWGDIFDSDGKAIEPSSDCEPFRKNEEGKFIFPCGAVANSMFNDEIELYYRSERETKKVGLKNTGIAWSSDKQFKFRNPKNFETIFNNSQWKEFAAPKSWKKTLHELDPLNKENNGLQNEDFIVWMRTSALPAFRKLFRIIDNSQAGFKYGMPAGNYTLNITYNYAVTSFQGTKKIIFSTTSLLGGKNPFLGIAYMVVGTICLMLGIIFLFIHIGYGKSTWEMTNIDRTTPYH